MSSTASDYSTSLPGTPPAVLVPDDEIVVASGRPRRRISRLLQQFDKIDLLKSPARVKHQARAQKWRSVVATAIGQRSPSDPIIHDILDDEPLLSVGVGQHKSPAASGRKTSPGARIMAAISLARSDKASSYLKPNAQATAPPPKPLWRRSPRLLDLAAKNTRWTRQNLSSIAKSAVAHASPRKRVSFQPQPQPQANDALDQFMQREPRATLHGTTTPAAQTSENLQALCLAKRRAVLLEMGVDESELHPSLRGYAAPRRQQADALDTFMGGA